MPGKPAMPAASGTHSARKQVAGAANVAPQPQPGKGGRVKHVPIRTCVVCREKAGKRTLTRVVRTADGVVLDSSGKMNGRGAYLCEQAACWERAISSDVLAKALKTTLTAEDRARLREGMAVHGTSASLSKLSVKPSSSVAAEQQCKP